MICSDSIIGLLYVVFVFVYVTTFLECSLFSCVDLVCFYFIEFCFLLITKFHYVYSCLNLIVFYVNKFQHSFV